MPSEHAIKVCYKTSDAEFFVIANSEQVSKWKSDKSTPLVDVVQAFEVYTTNAGGNTGEYIKPSKGVLESNFNTANTDEIIKKIISEGEEKGF